ncbi:MAG: methyltransferase, partial [Pseudomonadota bacterium]
MTRLALFAALPLLATACAAEDSGATAQAAAEVAPAPAAAEPVLTRIDYDAVLAGDHRSEENRARDPYRRPAETLAFFGLEPGMTVVEINPGGGWYTEVLAPAVGPEGKLYAAQVDPAASERAAKRIADYDAKLASNPAYVNTERVVFWNKSLDMPDGVADMVVAFRTVPHRHKRGEAPAACAEIQAA